MEPSLTAANHFPTIHTALEDIFPEETTSPSMKERSVYQYYVDALAARPSDEDLRPFRHKALIGRLTPPDSEHMHTLFQTVKSFTKCRHAPSRSPHVCRLRAPEQLGHAPRINLFVASSSS